MILQPRNTRSGKSGTRLPILIAVSLFTLAACGGGGGDDPQPIAGWQEAELIEIDNIGDAWSPQIAVDANGNAIAVWRQHDGTLWNIWANHYATGVGWGAAELIETDDAGDAGYPKITIDTNGNALAVWEQSDGSRDNIWANRYTTGLDWGTAELIETDDAGDAGSPQIDFDTDGNAIAVWRQYSSSRYGNILANRYTPGSGWGSAELIQTNDTEDASGPQIAIDASGNAITVWQQHDGTRFNIWANRYIAGSGWGTAELIETNDAGVAALPKLSIDASGNAIAVWQQSDGSHYNIWASRYTAGSDWGTPEMIETNDAGDARKPQIAFDADGNAIAVWQQHDGTRYNIWANRYTPGTGWGTAELIETNEAGDAKSPQIAIDAGGNAIAVWRQHDGTRFNIWTNRYTTGLDWGTAELIETDDAGDAGSPQIDIDADGNATVVWQQHDGTRYNIWANRWVAP